ncbi:hypothetical protein SDC9_42619 [bioreactor metagenome]|jgi:hypothetical protein|uniref:Uncharacterized protein n=1 Tax=bioreactor metagenome TaxID=1076179 RepID=A0A644VYE5_9ZZZZ|nr:hypothetical protein [Paludibacter sp.]
MILKEENDRMYESYLVCQKHLQRMEFAYSKISNLFPLNLVQYESISQEELSYFDQFIFRFTKLQDCMGNKLFKYILESLAENTRELSLIDMVAKAEQLNIIESAETWFTLRLIRNKLAHEYPFNTEEILAGLNELHFNFQILLKTWKHTETFMKKKFGYLM